MFNKGSLFYSHCAGELAGRLSRRSAFPWTFAAEFVFHGRIAWALSLVELRPLHRSSHQALSQQQSSSSDDETATTAVAATAVGTGGSKMTYNFQMQKKTDSRIFLRNSSWNGVIFRIFLRKMMAHNTHHAEGQNEGQKGFRFWIPQSM
jgi:hypothetical protein